MSDIYDIANTWVLEYTCHRAWHEFVTKGTIDLDNISNVIITMYMRRCAGSKLQRWLIKLATLLCPLSDGLQYDIHYFKNTDKTVLEYALCVYDDLLAEENLPCMDLTEVEDMRALLKVQAVVVCCRNKDFPRARRVASRLYGVEEPIPPDIQRMLEKGEDECIVLEKYPYKCLIDGMVALLRPIYDALPRPFVLRATESCLAAGENVAISSPNERQSSINQCTEPHEAMVPGDILYDLGTSIPSVQVSVHQWGQIIAKDDIFSQTSNGGSDAPCEKAEPLRSELKYKIREKRLRMSARSWAEARALSNETIGIQNNNSVLKMTDVQIREATARNFKVPLSGRKGHKPKHLDADSDATIIARGSGSDQVVVTRTFKNAGFKTEMLASDVSVMESGASSDESSLLFNPRASRRRSHVQNSKKPLPSVNEKHGRVVANSESLATTGKTADRKASRTTFRKLFTVPASPQLESCSSQDSSASEDDTDRHLLSKARELPLELLEAIRDEGNQNSQSSSTEDRLHSSPRSPRLPANGKPISKHSVGPLTKKPCIRVNKLPPSYAELPADAAKSLREKTLHVRMRRLPDSCVVASNDAANPATEKLRSRTRRHPASCAVVKDGIDKRNAKNKVVLSKGRDSALGEVDNLEESTHSTDDDYSPVPDRHRRRKVMKCIWSHSEERMLYNAVQEYGAGNWAAIVKTSMFPKRNNIQLKDKWRQMMRSGVVKRFDMVFKHCDL